MPLCHLEECNLSPLGYMYGTTVFVVTMQDGSLWQADSVVGEKPMTTNDWFAIGCYGAMSALKLRADACLQDGFCGLDGTGLTLPPAVLKELVLFACRYEGLSPSTVETLDEYLLRTRLGASATG